MNLVELSVATPSSFTAPRTYRSSFPPILQIQESPRSKSVQHDDQKSRLKRRRQDGHPPPSLAAAHKRILKEIRSIEVAFSHFLQENTIRLSDYAGAAREVIQRAGLEESNVETPQAFKTTLLSIRGAVDEEERQWDELMNIANTAIDVEDVVPDLLVMINECVESQLKVYCCSFKQQFPNRDIPCIDQYENKIQEICAELNQKTKELTDNFAEYKYLRSPFVKGHLEGNDDALDSVQTLVATGHAICGLLRKWVTLDDEYPPTLFKHVRAANRRRNALLEGLKRLKHTREKYAQAWSFAIRTQNQFENGLANIRAETRKVQKHLADTKANCSHAERLLAEGEDNLEKLNSDNSNKTNSSPKYLDIAWAKRKQQEAELARLQTRLVAARRQQGRYESELNTLEVQLDHRLKELAKLQESTSVAAKELEDCDHYIENLQEQLDRERESVNVATTVREYKLATGSVRKVYIVKEEQTDELLEALKLISPHLGRHWENVYMTLLFKPPRKPEQRQNDLDQLKKHSVSRNITGRQMAWRALLKWRLLNRTATVQQLEMGLRRAHLTALVQLIKDENDDVMKLE